MPTTVSRALSVFGALVGSAQAVIIINFKQVGPDVQAEVTGSLDLTTTTLFVRDQFVVTERFAAGSSSLHASYAGLASRDVYNRNSVTLTTLTGTITDWSGAETFGYDGAALYVPPNTPESDPNFTPTGTFTWANQSLADIGMGSLTTTPMTVFMTEGGDTIQFALAAIPEPSSSLLLGLAGFALLGRRSRR